MQKIIEAFTIFGKYTSSNQLSSVHGQIGVDVSEEQCPIDSEDGVRLFELGWDIEEEYWVKDVFE
jgi:hypothetical protein